VAFGRSGKIGLYLTFSMEKGPVNGKGKFRSGGRVWFFRRDSNDSCPLRPGEKLPEGLAQMLSSVLRSTLQDGSKTWIISLFSVTGILSFCF